MLQLFLEGDTPSPDPESSKKQLVVCTLTSNWSYCSVGDGTALESRSSSVLVGGAFPRPWPHQAVSSKSHLANASDYTLYGAAPTGEQKLHQHVRYPLPLSHLSHTFISPSCPAYLLVVFSVQLELLSAELDPELAAALSVQLEPSSPEMDFL